MLGKLLKYEMRATSRWFLPIYGILMATAVLMRIMMSIRDSIYTRTYEGATFGTNPDMLANVGNLSVVLTTTIYVFVIAAVFVITIVIIVQRFYKNLLSDEGYLMFTLPVRSWENIMCKLILAMFWILIGVLVTGLSLAVVFYNKLFSSYFSLFLTEAWEALIGGGFDAVAIAWLSLSNAVVATIAMVLQIYAAIAIGQLSNNHKVLCSFGAYIGLNIARSILGGIVSIFLIVAGTGSVSLFSLIFSAPDSTILPTLMYTSLGIELALNAAIMIVFFMVTNNLLAKRLNLE